MSCIEAFGSLNRRFAPLGWLAALIPVIIAPYYCVIGGWVVKYFVEFVDVYKRQAPVTVVGQETASDGVRWYKLQFTAGGKSMEGYASSEYIKFPVSYTTDPQFEAYMTSQGFPESYKESLRVLHAEFPSWVFQVQNTGPVSYTHLDVYKRQV